MEPTPANSASSIADVSVIIAAYNAARTIRHAVSSVLLQTVPPREILVCDDASIDRTASIIGEFEDSRVKLIRNTTNLGPGLSRDNAIAKAQAGWIAFLDADDAWHPERLRKLLPLIESNSMRIVFDDVMICHDVAGTMVPWRRLHGLAAFGTRGSAARDIRLEDYICSLRLLIKPIIPLQVIRDSGVRHSDRRFAEDAEFVIRLALRGGGLCYVPEPLYFYRVSPGSLTATARDRTLMRQCLEGCAQWPDVSARVGVALARKISALRINEALYDLWEQVRQGHLYSALKILGKHPNILKVLPQRLGRHLSYQLNRMMHGGVRR